MQLDEAMMQRQGPCHKDKALEDNHNEVWKKKWKGASDWIKYFGGTC